MSSASDAVFSFAQFLTWLPAERKLEAISRDCKLTFYELAEKFQKENDLAVPGREALYQFSGVMENLNAKKLLEAAADDAVMFELAEGFREWADLPLPANAEGYGIDDMLLGDEQ